MSDINNTGLSKPQMKNLMKFLSDATKIPVIGAGGGFAPIGVGNWYMGSVAPQGWLICDGTIYNIADYPEFAAFIASNYESANAFGGDGVTTFAVPDCRGEYFRMIGENSHANQGDGGELGEHQDATEIPYIYATTSSLLGVNRFPSNQTLPDKLDSTPSYGTVTAGITLNGTSTAGSNVASFTSRPTTTCWNFIVKATVSGDANAHQYSTEEQIVGTTEDGEYIYERVLTGLSLSATWAEQYEARATATLSSLGLSNIKDIYYSSCFSVAGSTKRYETPSIMISSGNLTIGIHTTATINKLIVQYTKTSS